MLDEDVPAPEEPPPPPEKDPTASVRALQDRLADLGFLPRSGVDGQAGEQTRFAVLAFQKWARLDRDGVAGPRTKAALERARRPTPRTSGGGRRVEVLLDRQLALYINRGRVVRTLHVSSGASGFATPTGRFTVFRKERNSWSVPYKVWLPWASYFVGGVAFHESPDVPAFPASHGCVRVPRYDAQWLYDRLPNGTAGHRARDVMIRRLLLLALLAATLAPAGAAAQVPTKTPGQLVVGVSMPAAGFQVGAVRGRDVLFAKGYEIDLATAIARELGVPSVRFVQEDRFSAFFAAGAKDYDLALSQISITAARDALVDFSRPYFVADQAVLLRRGLTLQRAPLRGAARAPPLRRARDDRGQAGAAHPPRAAGPGVRRRVPAGGRALPAPLRRGDRRRRAARRPPCPGAAALRRARGPHQDGRALRDRLRAGQRPARVRSTERSSRSRRTGPSGASPPRGSPPT